VVQESTVGVGDKKSSRHVRVTAVHTTRQMADTGKRCAVYHSTAVYHCFGFTLLLIIQFRALGEKHDCIR
jgi:hypothetical protein